MIEQTYSLSNCLCFALWQWIQNPAIKIRTMRNSRGRLHVYWIEQGRKFEFYGPGASRRPYWKNILYAGYRKEITTPQVKS